MKLLISLIFILLLSVFYLILKLPVAPIEIPIPVAEECIGTDTYEQGFHDGAVWFKDKVLEYNPTEDKICEDCRIS